jgi:hypothetical protein
LIADARELALALPDRVLLAALDYVLRERVADAVVQGGRVAARVLGSRDEYRAEAAMEPLRDTRCSCSLRQPCRHSAAVAIAYLRHPEQFVRLAGPGDAPSDAVFALVAGRVDPLAPLRPARGDAVNTAPQAPNWRALRAAADLGALDAAVRWLERQAVGERDDDQAAQAAATLAALAPLAPTCGPDRGRRLASLYTALDEERLGRALGAFLHALEGPALAAARAALEHALWASADQSARGGGEEGAARALAWLCEEARARGGEEAALALARAHEGLSGSARHEAESLWRLGRPDEAAHVAQAAYLHACGDDSGRLYALLREMGSAGHAGAQAFLRAAWEADPRPDRLEDLLAMGDAQARAATRVAAEAVLARHHRFDLLTALARQGGDQEAAVRWALRDGSFAAPPSDCRSLADAVAADRPLLALELLGAAYRRERDPERRRRVVARARALGHDHAELGQAWPVLRRRWFPEGGQTRSAPPS